MLLLTNTARLRITRARACAALLADVSLARTTADSPTPPPGAGAAVTGPAASGGVAAEAFAKAKAGSLGAKIGSAMGFAVELLRCDSLPSRPLYVEEDSPSQCLFREVRSGPNRYSQRLYARHMPRPYDVWQQHGGTSVSRVRLPARLQDGEGAQVLVRRSGKIVRHGRPDLHFHQYEIGPCEAAAQDPDAKVQVLYHCWRKQSSSSTPPQQAAPAGKRKRPDQQGVPPGLMRLPPAAAAPANGAKAGSGAGGAYHAPPLEASVQIPAIDYGLIAGGRPQDPAGSVVTAKHRKIFAALFSTLAMAAVLVANPLAHSSQAQQRVRQMGEVNEVNETLGAQRWRLRKAEDSELFTAGFQAVPHAW